MSNGCGNSEFHNNIFAQNSQLKTAKRLKERFDYVILNGVINGKDVGNRSCGRLRLAKAVAVRGKLRNDYRFVPIGRLRPVCGRVRDLQLRVLRKSFN